MSRPKFFISLALAGLILTLSAVGCEASRATQQQCQKAHSGRQIHDAPPEGVYPVLRVIDGDTLDIGVLLADGSLLRQRVRLAIINTPERGKPGYDKATADLRRLAGDRVRIEYETKNRKRGRYGRLICLLYRDNLCINREMLRLGWPEYKRPRRKSKQK